MYRRRVSHGEVTGALDGPIHAEEVGRWTKDCINHLKQFNSSESIVNVDSTESQASPRTSGKRVAPQLARHRESQQPVVSKAGRT